MIIITLIIILNNIISRCNKCRTCNKSKIYNRFKMYKICNKYNRIIILIIICIKVILIGCNNKVWIIKCITNNINLKCIRIMFINKKRIRIRKKRNLKKNK